MSADQRLLAIAALLVVAFLTGVWLNRTGRPYGSARLTIHKLIALAAAILVAVTMDSLRAQTAMNLAAIGVNGVLFLAAGISGGLLSTGRPPAAAVRLLHWVAPALAVLSTTVTLWLLMPSPS